MKVFPQGQPKSEDVAEKPILGRLLLCKVQR
jgi:hypothetical protein